MLTRVCLLHLRLHLAKPRVDWVGRALQVRLWIAVEEMAYLAISEGWPRDCTIASPIEVDMVEVWLLLFHTVRSYEPMNL